MLIRIKEDRYKVGYFGSKKRMCVMDTVHPVERVTLFFENGETEEEAQEYVERLNQLNTTAELAKLTSYEVVVVTTPPKPAEEVKLLLDNKEAEPESGEGLKWGCEVCEYTWFGSHFETFIECPNCGCGHVSHY